MNVLLNTIVLVTQLFSGICIAENVYEWKMINQPLAVVNGYIVKYNEAIRIKEEFIESKIVIDAEDAVKIFGERASKGALVITLKNKYAHLTSSNKMDEELLQKAYELAEKKKNRIRAHDDALKDRSGTKTNINSGHVGKDLEGNTEMSPEFLSRLQQEFEKSILNPKVKKILVNGKETTKAEALKINVFDVETSITTYNSSNTEGILDIKLSEK